MTSGLQTERDNSRRKGRDGQKKKLVNQIRMGKSKKEQNMRKWMDKGGKKTERGYPGPTDHQHSVRLHTCQSRANNKPVWNWSNSNSCTAGTGCCCRCVLRRQMTGRWCSHGHRGSRAGPGKGSARGISNCQFADTFDDVTFDDVRQRLVIKRVTHSSCIRLSTDIQQIHVITILPNISHYSCIKLKASHIRHRPLGQKLIAMYRQSARSDYKSSTRQLAAITFHQACTFSATLHHHPLASTRLYCLVTEAHRCEQLAASAPSRIWTHNLLITSPTIYLLRHHVTL